jgi:hypothetical protein
MKTAALALAITASANAGLINGGFESFPSWGYTFYNGTIPEDGWATTAPDNLLEIWENGFLGVPAYEGYSFAELNANHASTLYQHIGGVASGTAVNWHFAHRGRYGVDTMRLSIYDLGADSIYGNGDDTILLSQEFSADNTDWVVNYGSVTSVGNTMRFAFEAVSAVGGNTQGNFVDWCDFGVGVIPAPGAISLLAIGAIIGGTRRRR